MKEWAEQLFDDVSELDNKCYNEMPLTILIRTDLNDDGERYFDCSIYKGHADMDEGVTLVDVIGAESLFELFSELVKEWK